MFVFQINIKCFMENYYNQIFTGILHIGLPCVKLSVQNIASEMLNRFKHVCSLICFYKFGLLLIFMFILYLGFCIYITYLM